MAEVIVVNTGPLIAWHRMDCLEAIGQPPFNFVCPAQVRQELDDGGVAGHPRIGPPWLQVRSLSSPVPSLNVLELDPDEAAAIHLGLDLQPTAVAIDEWKGRRAALAVGLRVTGSLGLVAKARQQGLVPAVRPLVERAAAAGIRYHAEVVRRVLQEIGEVLAPGSQPDKAWTQHSYHQPPLGLCRYPGHSAAARSSGPRLTHGPVST
ncbi:MAG: DUF3368 domain-containing protein [Candidatus Latescibacterota bacterium]